MTRVTPYGGRPLRFLTLVIGGWIALRTVQLWPVPPGPLPAIVAAIAPPAAAAVVDAMRLPTPFRAGAQPPASIRPAPAATAALPSDAGAAAAATPAPGSPVTLELAGFVPVGATATAGQDAPIAGSPIAPPRASAAAPRFAGSAWLIARGGSGPAAPFVPQLGGSQAGARLTYAIGDGGRIALAGRLSSALGVRQREAAVGLDWQPTPLPVHLVAEQRIGIERARGGPSLAVIGGLPPLPVAAGFDLQGYAQAGAIARDGVEGYADGALRIARSVATAGAARIEIGLGAWGGAQPGAARVDVGPAAGIVLPAGARAVRISLEWRQRVAGKARPGSGIALALGSDF